MNHKEAAQLLRGDVIRPRAMKADERSVDRPDQAGQAEENLVLDNNLFFDHTDLPDLPLHVRHTLKSLNFIRSSFDEAIVFSLLL